MTLCSCCADPPSQVSDHDADARPTGMKTESLQTMLFNLCLAVESLPASEQQTALSEQAGAVYRAVRYGVFTEDLERWCYNRALSEATIHLRSMFGGGRQNLAFDAIAKSRDALGVSGYGNSGAERSKPKVGVVGDK